MSESEEGARSGIGDILLPGFVLWRAQGILVDLSALDSHELFQTFVDRLFSSGARFVDIDYPMFGKLLFTWEAKDIERELERCEQSGRQPLFRVASDMVAFPEARRALYRGIKVLEGGKAAEYLFEQIVVDEEEGVPGSGRRAYLDFDEFVAELWNRGVRFGIDAAVVREAIEKDATGRIVIAHQLAAVEGHDASIEELSDRLHRDNKPKLLPDGRVDLKQFANRFPQVTLGTQLFRKIPRDLGVVGWTVQGRELAPPKVKDLDIEAMAGPGTRVERTPAGEFVVAIHDGFLSVESATGMLSVVDKIVNREGVSARTTGDLKLDGDDYEEHGEVQEKRTINGHNMTFMADVFGNANSNGGHIHFKRNLSGGSAFSPGGSVAVEGKASRAVIDTGKGEVKVKDAEGCMIFGGCVHIERAILCDIVADEVTIGDAEGCVIAARKITLDRCGARRNDGTMLSLLLPDRGRMRKRLGEIAQMREKAQLKLEERRAAQQALLAQPDLKSYLTIQPKLKSGEMVMNEGQKAQWQKLLDRAAAPLRQMAQLGSELKAAQEAVEALDKERHELETTYRQSLAAISCTLGQIHGHTQVRMLRESADMKPLRGLSQKDLRARLSEGGGAADGLFADSVGSFEWRPGEDS